MKISNSIINCGSNLFNCWLAFYQCPDFGLNIPMKLLVPFKPGSTDRFHPVFKLMAVIASQKDLQVLVVVEEMLGKWSPRSVSW